MGQVGERLKLQSWKMGLVQLINCGQFGAGDVHHFLNQRIFEKNILVVSALTGMYRCDRDRQKAHEYTYVGSSVSASS